MLPSAVQIADPFHVVKLANHVLDETRRRVQNETLGHRGRFVWSERLGQGVKVSSALQSIQLVVLDALLILFGWFAFRRRS